MSLARASAQLPVQLLSGSFSATWVFGLQHQLHSTTTHVTGKHSTVLPPSLPPLYDEDLEFCNANGFLHWKPNEERSLHYT